MSAFKGVSLRPGISPQEMHEVWEHAIQRAERHPGSTVTLFLAPGEYPIPDSGEYVYREDPVLLQVPEPGVEVRFRYSRASGTQITTVQMASLGETA